MRKYEDYITKLKRVRKEDLKLVRLVSSHIVTVSIFFEIDRGESFPKKNTGEKTPDLTLSLSLSLFLSSRTTCWDTGESMSRSTFGTKTTCSRSGANCCRSRPRTENDSTRSTRTPKSSRRRKEAAAATLPTSAWITTWKTRSLPEEEEEVVAREEEDEEGSRGNPARSKGNPKTRSSTFESTTCRITCASRSTRVSGSSLSRKEDPSSPPSLSFPDSV